MFKELSLTGWGRSQRGSAATARPERISDIARLFAQDDSRSLCGRGAGRSYGDCAMNTGGVVVLSERLSRILAFDETTGVIAVEPGVTFRQLMRQFLPRGWFVPVSPGTAFVTVAGAVANDVHGKNHEHAGSFGQHVVELDVMTPDGSVHTIDPARKPDWFRATIGGLGLTGILTRIVFRMMRVPGPCVQASEKRVADIEAFFAGFEAAKAAAYSVGWIDTMARGRSMGRGILETAEPASGAERVPHDHGPNLIADFPSFTMNPLTISAFNAAYYARVPARGRARLRHYAEFFYPLDAVQNWNRIYGAKGFHQFQCVVPATDGLKAISRLLEEVSGSRSASFLAVLKHMGPGRAGFLSFPMEGYTLAIDFPSRPVVADLHALLVRIVLDHGGRIYLAKDSLLTAGEVGQMYPELAAFRRAAAEMDPKGRMDSDLARRLLLKGTA